MLLQLVAMVTVSSGLNHNANATSWEQQVTEQLEMTHAALELHSNNCTDWHMGRHAQYTSVHVDGDAHCTVICTNLQQSISCRCAHFSESFVFLKSRK